MKALGASTWPRLTAVRGDGVLVVPLGATEQHGPHLPLGTDTEIARALAAELAARRPEVAVAPALAFGASGEHADFPGTLSIGGEATERVLIELGRSADRTFGRLLFVSAHGGNADSVEGAVALLRGEGREVRSWSPSFPGDAHAGWTETSLMLAIDPNAVDLAKAEGGAVEAIDELLPRLRAEGVRAVSPNGVLGDPLGASPDVGRELLAAAGDELAALVREWGVGP